MTGLSSREWEVARLVGMGFDCERIGLLLQIRPKTVHVHVYNIAAKLPNPDELKPYALVLLWAAHERWLLTLHDAA